MGTIGPVGGGPDHSNYMENKHLSKPKSLKLLKNLNTLFVVFF